MAYIPIEHQKYDILPLCRQYGGEVFSYSTELENKIDRLLPDGESVIPYGYASYEQFEQHVDYYISNYGVVENSLNQLGQLLIDYKVDIKRRNIKENWSIVKYVGENHFVDLTHGRYYYWPCLLESPEYEGVVDDEEFTSYLYPTDFNLWEIILDPTGMAHRTINNITL